METNISFIVVDDDPINNMVCRMVIERLAPKADIQTFTIPEEGFAYISKQYLTTDNPTALFLDINMPSWSGWDFLDHFENLDYNIKKQFQIHLLSSSIDPNDKKRAAENKNVKSFIEKPLNKAILQKMFG
ncbi:MAG: response regulator [Bacteroidota bacterium]|nr:response regulator [Bacteroidota bacterium]